MLHLPNDVDKLKTKVKQLENATVMMDDEAFECMRLAKEKSGLSYVIKGNGLKRKSGSNPKTALQRNRKK